MLSRAEPCTCLRHTTCMAHHRVLTSQHRTARRIRSDSLRQAAWFCRLDTPGSLHCPPLEHTFQIGSSCTCLHLGQRYPGCTCTRSARSCWLVTTITPDSSGRQRMRRHRLPPSISLSHSLDMGQTHSRSCICLPHTPSKDRHRFQWRLHCTYKMIRCCSLAASQKVTGMCCMTIPPTLRM